MYAVEFETDIQGEFIALKDYEKLINKHVRVIILVEEPILDKLQKNKIDEVYWGQTPLFPLFIIMRTATGDTHGIFRHHCT